MSETPSSPGPELAGPAAPPPIAIRACLVRLAGARLAVDVKHVREVAVLEDVTVVPRLPAFVKGVANLHGTIIALVDVGPLIGLGAAQSPRGITALVVQHGSIHVGIAVDLAEGLEPFAEIRPPSSGRGQDLRFVRGALARGPESVPLLDTERIVAALVLELRRADHTTASDQVGAGWVSEETEVLA